MRIIVSRKGFDSKYGGVPSPILPDGRLLSLPIPLAENLAYGEITFDGANVGDLVAHLTKGRLRSSDPVHLDPDLRADSLSRDAGWLPCFGQSDQAASHLQAQNIEVGDLFLFFGWFRQTEGEWPKLRYVRKSPNLHVLFGWLQVGAVHRLPDPQCSVPSWLNYHPHISGTSAKAKNNVIYVAAPTLELGGERLPLPGGGMFSRFSSELQLTHPESRLRSTWRVPKWFKGDPSLTYHGEAWRWSDTENETTLRVVDIGQEFVLCCATRPDSRAWLSSLFATECDRARGASTPTPD
jgi:hypothetical protein